MVSQLTFFICAMAIVLLFARLPKRTSGWGDIHTTMPIPSIDSYDDTELVEVYELERSAYKALQYPRVLIAAGTLPYNARLYSVQLALHRSLNDQFTGGWLNANFSSIHMSPMYGVRSALKNKFPWLWTEGYGALSKCIWYKRPIGHRGPIVLLMTYVERLGLTVDELQSELDELSKEIREFAQFSIVIVPQEVTYKPPKGAPGSQFHFIE